VFAGVTDRSIPALLAQKTALKISYKKARSGTNWGNFMGMLRASCGVAQHDNPTTYGHTKN
jgi:hypothetical protein